MSIASVRQGLKTRRTLIRAIGLPVAALVFAINVIGGPSHGSVLRPPATDQEIVAFVGDQIRDTGIPGGAVAIVRDGHVSTTQGFGTADATGRPVTATTPFTIGSLSKSITATAVMQLVERGSVALDTPVQHYVPDFQLADGNAASAITVRQLLVQTSGLPPSAGQRPLSQPSTDLAGQVAALDGVRPVTAPGSTYAYSNANYVVLGRLIETVAGEPFGTYVDEHVFEPLGMTHAHSAIAAADADGLSRAHRMWFGLPREVQPLFRPDLEPAGFLMASASDLGRYVAAEVDGGTLDGSRLLSAASVTEMEHGVADTNVGDGSRYGFGWVDSEIGGIRMVGHVGSTTDMASAAFFSPEQKTGVVILLNGQSTLYELAHKPDLIGIAAFELLEGREPDGTITAMYPAFDVIALLLVGFVVWRLLVLVRRARRGSVGAPTVFGNRWLGVATTVWLSVIVPVEIFFNGPNILGAPWTTLVQIDLGLVAFAFASLRAATGLVWLAILLASLQRRWQAGRRVGGWGREVVDRPSDHSAAIIAG
jgi:CubicO group peptidase (beta-lactamase class C family)